MMVAGSVTSCRVCCRYMCKRKTRQKNPRPKGKKKKKRGFSGRISFLVIFSFHSLQSSFPSVCVCVWLFFSLSLSLLLPGENERGRSSHTRQSRSSSPPRDKSRAHLDSFFSFFLLLLAFLLSLPLFFIPFGGTTCPPTLARSPSVCVCVCVLVGCD